MHYTTYLPPAAEFTACNLPVRHVLVGESRVTTDPREVTCARCRRRMR